ncbi:CCAAT box binding factor family isoform 1 [Galdieria sulphuraria]|uniref:CCAAT box binding factor family isoform 1 n=1 Tax=Galdieria sulphuraria TaxID=130081 RepID=M2W871_GALSU|nr:CCAAT box binding factor family isoform 1 [Galdieria sulphuraria]EME32066.1 CCAAT box binding factor family isoform 1 [Galdieria sulphuraria]|eukprot:XP_005708586.1 CCAAT box binding factor family isoform 1 [Galdieria sulphuraria]
MRGKSKSVVFPASRIKRIMRINEEVGKIAVPTPVLVSKALQLMLQDFLTSCCDTARKHKSTVITPYLMKLCMRNYDRFAFLLKLLESKLESLPVEIGSELFHVVNERNTIDLTKERRELRKRRSTSDLSSKNEKKERSMALNNINFDDSKHFQCSRISPSCFSLKTEAEENNYDCDEDESKPNLLNTSSSVNDSPLVDDHHQLTDNHDMKNKHHEAKESLTEYKTKRERTIVSKIEEKERESIYCVAVVEDTSIAATCSPSSLPENDLYLLDKVESPSRVFISIEELVHSV